MYTAIVADPGAAGGRRRFHFTHDADGVWNGADANLFLCALATNRLGLAWAFFRREGRQDPVALLPGALWAGLLCRRLAGLPAVGSYHLRNGVEQAALRSPAPPPAPPPRPPRPPAPPPAPPAHDATKR